MGGVAAVDELLGTTPQAECRQRISVNTARSRALPNQKSQLILPVSAPRIELVTHAPRPRSSRKHIRGGGVVQIVEAGVLAAVDQAQKTNLGT